MKKKVTTGKELVLATGVVSIFIGIVTIIASLMGNQVIRQRNEEGVIASATVTDKRLEWVSSGRTSSRVNTFTVMFFEETGMELETVDLGAGFEIQLPKVGELGDFYSADIQRVSDKTFTSTHEGDEVEIIYLASNPEKAWVANDVADVGLWDGAGFVAAFFGAGIIFIVISLRMKPPFQSSIANG